VVPTESPVLALESRESKAPKEVSIKIREGRNSQEPGLGLKAKQDHVTRGINKLLVGLG
jgi:hypothetical protein